MGRQGAQWHTVGLGKIEIAALKVETALSASDVICVVVVHLSLRDVHHDESKCIEVAQRCTPNVE